MTDVRAIVDRIAAEFGSDADPAEVEAAAVRVLAATIDAPEAPVAEAILGVSLVDCSSRLYSTVRTHVYDKIRRIGSHLQPSFSSLAAEAGIATGVSEITTSPLAHAAPAATASEFVALAADLDHAAQQCGCDRIGGFSVDVERHLTPIGQRFLAAVSEALKANPRVHAALHCGSSLYGLNVDAVSAAAGLWNTDLEAETLARRFSFGCNTAQNVPAAPDAVLRIRVDVSPLLDAVSVAAASASAEELIEIAVRTFLPWSSAAGNLGKRCAEALSSRSGLAVVFDGLQLTAEGDAAWHRPALSSLLQSSGSVRARAGLRKTLISLPAGTPAESITASAVQALIQAIESSSPTALHVFVGGGTGSRVGSPSRQTLQRGHIPPGRLGI